MKKNNSKKSVVIMAAAIVAVCVACGKAEAGAPDVVSSMKFNRDETLTVIANRDKIEDKEAFANLLLQMYKDNSFESMEFSLDEGYPTSLDMRIYSWKDEIGKHDPIMTVEYKTEEWNPDYDIMNAPEQFHLYIDGEMVETEK